jgi:hypothetical protein
MDKYKEKATDNREVLESGRLLFLPLLAGQSPGPMRQQGGNYGEAEQGELQAAPRNPEAPSDLRKSGKRQ